MLVSRAIRKVWAELREGRGGALVDEATRTLAAAGDSPRTVEVPGKGTVDLVVADKRSPRLITVSLRSKKLRLYDRGRPVRTYRVGLGWGAHPTEAGLFAIQNKFVDPEWNVPDEPWAGDLAGTTVPPGDPENLVEARWMGVYPGVGIHGTSAVRTFGLRMEASRGCIRMKVPAVIDLFELVQVGTPVFIA